MGRPPEQLSCRALSLTTPLPLPESPKDVGGLLEALVRCRSPLALKVERRTDPQRFDEALAALMGLGFAESEALAILLRVLGTPAIAMKATDSLQFLQIAPVTTSQGCVRATVRVRVGSGKPPPISDLLIDVDPIDPAQDLTDLVLGVADWQRCYSAPGRAPKEIDEEWVLVGDLTRMSEEAPDDWRHRISCLANVLGTRHQWAKDGFAAVRMNAHRFKNIFYVAGTCTPKDLDRLKNAIPIGSRGDPYRDIVHCLADGLIALINAEPESLEQRLERGTVHYHRKIANGGGRDYFGPSLVGPCKHGADNFIRFNSAPQAEKGMRALYENFDDCVLMHCSSFPNCNVYAVKRR